VKAFFFVGLLVTLLCWACISVCLFVGDSLILWSTSYVLLHHWHLSVLYKMMIQTRFVVIACLRRWYMA
jgi:hypothetical protein